ncbi:MAG: hypothetical protein CTY18_07675 [Methylomonas sp.]|nr:MAG: hypothetical protein CTY24_07475 [Methylobacter sp.]PPD34835.1 MAG: hypothetical protein CTY18_07675 [Methylomonas sp.]
MAMNFLHTQCLFSARIQRLSRVLAGACLVLTVVLPLVVALYWLWADPVTLAVRANLPPGAVQGGLFAWQRIAGGLLTELVLVFLLLGIRQARRCLLLFTGNYVFTRQAVTYLSRFAAWAAVSALAEILAATIISTILTAGNPPGMQHIAVGVGSDQLMLLFFAGMVWLMAGVISQGQKLAEENASFV